MIRSDYNNLLLGLYLGPWLKQQIRYRFENISEAEVREICNVVMDLALKIPDKSLPTLESVQAYVWRIIQNHHKDWLKKRSDDQRLIKFSGGSDELEEIESNATYELETPPDAAEQGELAEYFDQGLAQLSPRAREIYLLKDQEGWTVAEIADKLKVSPKKIENQLYHARKKLREFVRAAFEGSQEADDDQN